MVRIRSGSVLNQTRWGPVDGLTSGSHAVYKPTWGQWILTSNSWRPTMNILTCSRTPIMSLLHGPSRITRICKLLRVPYWKQNHSIIYLKYTSRCRRLNRLVLYITPPKANLDDHLSLSMYTYTHTLISTLIYNYICMYTNILQICIYIHMCVQQL